MYYAPAENEDQQCIVDFKISNFQDSMKTILMPFNCLQQEEQMSFNLSLIHLETSPSYQ
jgi:hypothetical protein